jgi:hypothetical protein
VKSAENSLTVAKSEAARTESLVKGGALAARIWSRPATWWLARKRNSRQRNHANRHPSATRRHHRQGAATGIVRTAGQRRRHSVAGTPIVTIIDPSSMRL